MNISLQFVNIRSFCHKTDSYDMNFDKFNLGELIDSNFYQDIYFIRIRNPLNNQSLYTTVQFARDASELIINLKYFGSYICSKNEKYDKMYSLITQFSMITCLLTNI